RSAMNATARARASAFEPTASCDAKDLVSAIDPRGLHQEDQHGNRINKEAAGVGIKVLATGIEDSEHDGRDQRTFEAAETTHRNHKQKEHEIDHREARGQSEQLDRQTAAERRQSTADCKGQRE